MTNDEIHKKIREAVEQGDWSTAIDHAFKAPRNWNAFERLPSHAGEAGMPDHAVNMVLDKLNPHTLQASSLPSFLWELANSGLHHPSITTKTLQRIADLPENMMSKMVEDKILNHPKFHYSDEQKRLKSAADFWTAYERKVSPHHFAAVKSFFSGKPEKMIDHRGKEGSSHGEVAVSNTGVIRSLSHALLTPSPHHNQLDTKLEDIIPNFGDYSKRIQQTIEDDPEIQKRYIKGEPHVKLYRGLNGDYGKKIREAVNHDPETHAVDKKVLSLPVAPMSSWTLNPSTASSFAWSRGDIPGQEGHHGVVLSKWIPVKDIMHSGFHKAVLGQYHPHTSESEFVVGHPTGKIKVSTKEMYFQPKPTKEIPEDVDDAADNYGKVHLGQVRKNEDLEKGMKEKIASLATAAAIVGAPYHAEAPSKVPQIPKVSVTQEQGLRPIAYIESRNGVNMQHERVLHGLNAGTSAIGIYGFMPIQVQDTIKHDDVLRQKYGKLLQYHPIKQSSDIEHYLLNHPDAQHELANSHWHRVNSIFSKNKDRAIYAWKHGIHGAAHATSDTIKNDPYVKDYYKYQKMLEIEKPYKGNEPLRPVNKSEVLEKALMINPGVLDAAEEYAKYKGLQLKHDLTPVKINPEHGYLIASAYERMPHNPAEPEVKDTYNALVNETKDQYKHLLSQGYRFSPIRPGQDNPYKSSKDMLADVHNNKHLWYYPTEQGFGGEEQHKDHPLLQPTEFNDNLGKPMLANDVFRQVHDVFGHAMYGNSFGPAGEHKAYLAHKQMYTPAAHKALASETMGQNNWVNWNSKVGEQNRRTPEKTVYAEQKAGVLPPHILNENWHSDEIKKSDSNVLFHYSKNNIQGTIDPKHQGTGVVGEERKRPGRLPRSYYYDTPTDHEPMVVEGAKHKYTVHHPGKILDLSSDEAKHVKHEAKNEYGIIEPDRLEEVIHQKGYNGYKNSGGSYPNIVAVFKPLEIKSHQDLTLGKSEKVTMNRTEDLMREHGVLERILACMSEMAHRLRAGTPFNFDTLIDTTKLVHEFIGEYHEKNEEKYVFPKFKDTKLEDLVSLLKKQHDAGGEVIKEIAALTKENKESSEVTERDHIADLIEKFVRTVNWHKSTEETVVFPEYLKMVGDDALLEESYDKFDDAVARVTKIEDELGMSGPDAALHKSEFYPPLLDSKELVDHVVNTSDDADPEMVGNLLSNKVAYRKKFRLGNISVSPHKENHLIDEDKVSHYTSLPPESRPPIVVDDEGVIIDGHHRYLAAQANGEKYIDAYVAAEPKVLMKAGEGKGRTFDQMTHDALADLQQFRNSPNQYGSVFATGDKPRSTTYGAAPATLYSFGPHWPIARILDNKTIAVNTHPYGGQTQMLVDKVLKELPEYFPAHNIVEVNHPDYMKSAQIMRSGEKAIREHLEDASKNHPDPKVKAKAAEHLKLMSNLQKGTKEKRDAFIGYDPKQNEDVRVARLNRYLTSIGLTAAPHLDEEAGSKRMGRDTPTFLTTSPGEGPVEQQLTHEASHAMQTPPGMTLKDYQEAIGKPGMRVHDVMTLGKLPPEVRAQMGEAAISRRAGLSPFRARPGWKDPGTVKETAYSKAKEAQKLFDEGIVRFDPFEGRAEYQNTPNALINLRAMGEKALADEIRRRKFGKSEEELDKGVKQRLFPFDPAKDVTREDQKKLSLWTDPLETGQPTGRENTPRLVGNGRKRALHSLSARTKVRWNKEKNEREFLLHRGMSHSEHYGVTDSATNTISHPHKTSWTPKYNSALTFASNYDTGDKPGMVASAWVPESNIHHVPAQTGAQERVEEGNKAFVPGRGVLGPYEWRHEMEVIVDPGEYDMVDPADVEPVAKAEVLDLEHLFKSEFNPAEGVTDFIPLYVSDDNEREASYIDQMIKMGKTYNLPNKGLFTSESFIVGANPDHAWLIKVESNNRPGIKAVQDTGPQPVKEAAFYEASKIFGLSQFVPTTILGHIRKDGKEKWAVAIKMLPKSFSPMAKVNDEHHGASRGIMRKYHVTGLSHMLAFMLYVLGDLDSHGNNYMTDGHRIKLIDHGSSFADMRSEDKSDKKQHVPYVLRSEGFKKKMENDQKLSFMPRIATADSLHRVKQFILMVDPKKLEQVIASYKLDPRPEIARLKIVQHLVKFSEHPDIVLNHLWVNGAPQELIKRYYNGEEDGS